MVTIRPKSALNSTFLTFVQPLSSLLCPGFYGNGWVTYMEIYLRKPCKPELKLIKGHFTGKHKAVIIISRLLGFVMQEELTH